MGDKGKRRRMRPVLLGPGVTGMPGALFLATGWQGYATKTAGSALRLRGAGG